MTKKPFLQWTQSHHRAHFMNDRVLQVVQVCSLYKRNRILKRSVSIKLTDERKLDFLTAIDINMLNTKKKSIGNRHCQRDQRYTIFLSIDVI